MSTPRFTVRAALALAAVVAVSASALPQLTSAADNKDAAMTAVSNTTSRFAGAKVNGGTATATKKDGRLVLTFSDDFKIPDTPAPHWQVVDSQGNTYLLQRLKIKDDKINKTITVPAYVHNVAKVQIWCAWAEVLLGEAKFDSVVQ